MEPGMSDRVILMSPRKRIALIAHDNCKGALLSWARFNRDTLASHERVARLAAINRLARASSKAASTS